MKKCQRQMWTHPAAVRVIIAHRTLSQATNLQRITYNINADSSINVPL